jgi:hypothetical protein
MRRTRNGPHWGRKMIIKTQKDNDGNTESLTFEAETRSEREHFLIVAKSCLELQLEKSQSEYDEKYNGVPVGNDPTYQPSRNELLHDSMARTHAFGHGGLGR